MKNQPTIKNSESFIERISTPRGIIILGIIFIVCLGLLGIFLADTSGKNGSINMNTQKVTGVFIDVNGDGMIDYVTSAEVIINNGGASFSVSQPKNP